MKKLTAILFFVAATFAATIFQQCSIDVFDDENGSKQVLTDAQYESILKENVNALMAQSAEVSQHFMSIHGYPVWDAAQWTEVDSKRMLVVPLVTGDGSHKFIVGVASGKEMPAVVTEMSSSETRSSGHGGKRIYSLEGDILDEYGSLTTFVPRTRSGQNERGNSASAADVWLHNITLESFYNATYKGEYGGGGMYLGAKAGTLTMYVDSNIRLVDFSVGHAWVVFTDNYGFRNTFGTWPKGAGVNVGSNLRANEETRLRPTASTESTDVTYAELKSIISHNDMVAKNGWNLGNNCVDYATYIWYLAGGVRANVSSFVATPQQLERWINGER